MFNRVGYSILIWAGVLACSAWASDIGDYRVPFTDVWDDTGLWHFDGYLDTAISGSTMMVTDDDTAFAARNADIIFYDGSTQATSPSAMPKLVDPVAEGIGYPDANAAFGKCISFDGINDNARVAMSKVSIDPANLLISCWVRLSNSYTIKTGASYNLRYIDRTNQIACSMVNLSNGQMQNQITLWDAGNAVSYLTFTYDGSGIDPKQWHNVAVRCVGNDVKLYINGEVKQAATLGTAGLYPTSSLSDMYLGNRSTLAEAFYGYIDELRITRAVPQAPFKGYNDYDFNQDLAVDINDLKSFADHWLDTATGCPITAVPMDFNKNCVVDIGDFAIFAQQWLQCTDVANQQCGLGI